MTALTAERYSTRTSNRLYTDPVAANAVIYAGAVVVLDAAGNAAPATTATGLTVRGQAVHSADNTGGVAGAAEVQTRPAVVRLANSTAADAITRADIGNPCYLVDDQTVARTSASDTRSPAGPVVQVDADGVWVAVGIVVGDAA